MGVEVRLQGKDDLFLELVGKARKYSFALLGFKDLIVLR